MASSKSTVFPQPVGALTTRLVLALYSYAASHESVLILMPQGGAYVRKHRCLHGIEVFVRQDGVVAWI